MSFKKKLIVALLGIASSISASAGTTFPAFDFDDIAFIDPDLPYISYVNYKTLDPNSPLIESGQLRLPVTTTTGKLPAVVILHGSAGIDSRGKFYAEALNHAGIATLEVDLYAARGSIGPVNVNNRPRNPATVLPDAFGALKFLGGLPNIDPDKIAVLGFSAGGVISMLTATQPYNAFFSNALTDSTGKTLKFAAHVANYPICYLYNSPLTTPAFDFKKLTGSPVLIQEGSLDDYDTKPGVPDQQYCSNLVTSAKLLNPKTLISLNTYQNDTHGWDRLQPEMTVPDPFAQIGFGQNTKGTVKFKPNLPDAYLSRQRVVSFFETAFGM